MMIQDNEIDAVYFAVQNRTGEPYDNIYWQAVLDGYAVGWQKGSIPEGTDGNWVFLGQYYVQRSMVVTFQFGESGFPEMGGPTDLSAYVTRGQDRGGVRVIIGGQQRKASPFVNVNGVWKPAEPFANYSGDWRQTT